MKFLVTGATGTIGRLVVANLVTQGHLVHTLSRQQVSAQASTVRGFLGDLTASMFDQAVFEGVDALFLFPAWGGPIDAFLAQARGAGIGHAVVLSSLAAAQTFPRDLHSSTALHHLGIEEAVRKSGLGATILRPGSFANNLKQWAPTIRAQGMVFGPYPDSAQALIHEADIADVATAVLTTTSLRGGVHPMTGPEALTQRRQLKAIGDALGRELTYQTISSDKFRESMGRFAPAPIVQMLLDYWADTEKVPDAVFTTVEKLTGKPARTLDQWARDHAADFS